MLQFKNKITIAFLFIIGNTGMCFSGNSDDDLSKKDTLSAIVIAPSNPLYSSISKLSGKQIISKIDSLLELEYIPEELMKEFKNFVDDKISNRDFYNSLTYYYDNSEIPSNSTYGKWDTHNISPYSEALSKNDTSLFLTLTDKKNNCNFVNPIQNPVITSNFGWRNGRNHSGIDLDVQVWDPIVASFDGMVRLALFHPNYGRVVIIRHYNGLETLYAHLHRFKVKPGDIVEAGQVIGLGGSSGRSTGSHLHFEVRFKGKAINPKHMISFKKNKLISDTLQLIKHKWDYAALPVGLEYHTIEKGDFMYKIANRYGVSVSELCSINGITRNKILIVGRKLRIK
jgi:murein DD-endopeptidase MepM/ murein hydrolase activator NlpD